MAKKESRRVKTLSSFTKWAEQFEPGLYLFRGVSNEKHPIQASAYRRLLDERDQTPANLLEINKRIIDDARLEGHDLKNGQQLSDLELLAELQHYGAATCLIDFSYSAQVALWMACQRGSKRTADSKIFNSKVFAVNISNPDRFQKVTSRSLKKDIDYFFNADERQRYPLYQWQPKQQNNRIIAQQSVFLFGGAQIEPEAECIILKNSKESILTSLEKSGGITEARMFPDFDGLARLRAHDRAYVEPDALGYLQRGIDAHKERKLDEAIKHYTKSIQLKPDNPILTRAYNNRGNAYEGKGKHDLAFEDYSMAIEINPDNADAYFYRGFTYELERNFTAAIKDYDKVIELNPGYADAYAYRANAYSAVGRDAELIIKDYSKAIELNPNFAYAFRNRGLTYEKRGEVDRAIKNYSKAIKINSNSSLDYSYRGHAYKKRGEINLSIEDYRKAIDLNPHKVSNYHDLVIIWLHQRDWENVESYLTVAQNSGLDIINLFSQYYPTIIDLEEEVGVELPEDIAAMLYPVNPQS